MQTLKTVGRQWNDLRCFKKPKHVLTPAAIQRTSKYCCPAPSRKCQDFLGVHVRKTGLVPRAVCAESKSPRIRAPQPRVARDPRIIRPAPPSKNAKIFFANTSKKGSSALCCVHQEQETRNESATNKGVCVFKKERNLQTPPSASKHLKKKTKTAAPTARRAQGWITPQPRMVKGAKKSVLITG